MLGETIVSLRNCRDIQAETDTLPLAFVYKRGLACSIWLQQPFALVLYVRQVRHPLRAPRRSQHPSCTVGMCLSRRINVLCVDLHDFQ
jgi:hypothetical protein